jgi:hypothetical protein
MTGLLRHGFPAAAAAAAAAVLLAALLSPASAPGPPKPRHRAAVVEAGGAPQPGRMRGIARPSGPRRGRATAYAVPPGAPPLRAARRFLRYYLRWDRGETAPSVRAGIAATTSARLARLVLSAPPRLPPTLAHLPPPARPLALAAELAPGRRRADVRLEVARGRQRWGFQLVLRRSGRGWLAERVRD